MTAAAPPCATVFQQPCAVIAYANMSLTRSAKRRLRDRRVTVRRSQRQACELKDALCLRSSNAFAASCTVDHVLFPSSSLTLRNGNFSTSDIGVAPRRILKDPQFSDQLPPLPIVADNQCTITVATPSPTVVDEGDRRSIHVEDDDITFTGAQIKEVIRITQEQTVEMCMVKFREHMSSQGLNGNAIDPRSSVSSIDGVSAWNTLPQVHAPRCAASLEACIRFGSQVADKVCTAMDLALDKRSLLSSEHNRMHAQSPSSAASCVLPEYLNALAPASSLSADARVFVPHNAVANSIVSQSGEAAGAITTTQARTMYYAVKGGATPGIYGTYREACGHSRDGGLCKKFPSYHDAAVWAGIKTGGTT